MSNPRIRYFGAVVQVTPDTAADLVGRGLAELVEGEIVPPQPSVSLVVDVPTDSVEDTPARVVTAVPKAQTAKKPGKSGRR